MARQPSFAATLDSRYQEVDAGPITWGPWRPRTWVRRVFPLVAGLTTLGYTYSGNIPKVNFSLNLGGLFSTSKVSAKTIQERNTLSELEFGKAYALGLNEDLDDDLNDADNLAEAEAAFSKSYGTKPLTADQVIAQRKADAAYMATVKDEAIDVLRDKLDFNELIPTNRKVTSHYGKREKPKAGASTKHYAIDVKFWAGEPVVSENDLEYAGTGSIGDLNITTVIENHKDGKIRWELLHGAGLNIGNFDKGDKITAGTDFALTGEKDSHSTGTHIHFQASILKKNGKWKRIDPTKYIGQFMHAPGFTDKRKAVPDFIGMRLREADYDAFQKIDDQVKARFNNKKSSKKSKKFGNALLATFANYNVQVVRSTDSIVNADVRNDFAALEKAFGSNDDKDAVASSSAKKITPSAAMSLASIGASLWGSVDASDDATSARDKMIRASWGNHNASLNQDQLRQVLAGEEVLERLAAATKMTASAFVANVVGTVAKNKIALDPSPTNSQNDDKQIGFGLRGKTSRTALQEKFGLSDWPSDPFLDTDEGIRIQGEYILADYAVNKGSIAVNATASYNKAVWGNSVDKLSSREDLRPLLTESKMLSVAMAETGLSKEAIVQDIINVVADRENPKLVPDVKNPDPSASAIGFGQNTTDNIATLKRVYPQLPKHPGVKNRHLLKTELGMSIQADYLLANYSFNYRAARDADVDYKASHNGDGLFNKNYIRGDNGKATYIDYRRAATAGWGGIYGLIPHMKNMQSAAAKKKTPFAKYSLIMFAQDFTDYVDLSDNAAYRAKEAVANKTIAADKKLAAHYAVATKKKFPTKREDDSLKFAQAAADTVLLKVIVPPDTLAHAPADTSSHKPQLNLN